MAQSQSSGQQHVQFVGVPQRNTPAVDIHTGLLEIPWFQFLVELWTRVADPTVYTVASLPTTPVRGDRAYVTDALAPVFLQKVNAGGTVVCPVFFNGTDWVAG